MDAIRHLSTLRHDSHLIESLWTRTTTGTPEALVQAAMGYVTLQLNNNLPADPLDPREAQAHRLTLGTRPFRIVDLIWVEFEMASSENLEAGVTLAFGLARTNNDDVDAIDEGIWWKRTGANMFVDNRDGVVDLVDVPVAESVHEQFKRFRFNFRDGVWLGDPRDGGSRGASAAIVPEQEVDRGNYNQLRPAARGTRFTLGGATDTVAPFIQVTKVADVMSSAALHIRSFRAALRNVPFDAA